MFMCNNSSSKLFHADDRIWSISINISKDSITIPIIMGAGTRKQPNILTPRNQFRYSAWQQFFKDLRCAIYTRHNCYLWVSDSGALYGDLCSTEYDCNSAEPEEDDISDEDLYALVAYYGF
jgi:hypothetical protein